MHCDVLHGQKNCVFQHTFSTASGMGANGNPKSAAIDKDSFTGTTYRMMYSKCNNIATLQVWDAMGRKLILEDDNTFDLTQTYETLQSGRSVRYGIAVGYWKDKDDIRKNWAISNTFHPALADAGRQELLSGWERAVRCALAWAEA
jgi:hypothetical protein